MEPAFKNNNINKYYYFYSDKIHITSEIFVRYNRSSQYRGALNRGVTGLIKKSE